MMFDIAGGIILGVLGLIGLCFALGAIACVVEACDERALRAYREREEGKKEHARIEAVIEESRKQAKEEQEHFHKQEQERFKKQVLARRHERLRNEAAAQAAKLSDKEWNKLMRGEFKS